MRNFLISMTCAAALTLLALTPTQGQAAWVFNRYYVPYSYGYYAPTSSSAYYYGSYYYPSTAYYYPSTAYYAPSTAYYAPSSSYYYGAYAPAPLYYYPSTSLDTGSYYQPYAYTTYGSYAAPLGPTTTYRYGAYVPPATTDYYTGPAATAVVPATSQNVTSVSITDNGFEPKTITIAPGTTVRWVNNGSKTHTVSSDAKLFDSGELNHRSSFSHTFDRAGTFYYHSSIEPNKMPGEVIVK
jgi:plastocyanin